MGEALAIGLGSLAEAHGVAGIVEATDLWRDVTGALRQGERALGRRTTGVEAICLAVESVGVALTPTIGEGQTAPLCPVEVVSWGRAFAWPRIGR